MTPRNGIVIVILGMLCLFAATVFSDRQCAARAVKGQSVVCVCNLTYCDDVARTPPAGNQYVLYTSTESGLRFNKTIGVMQNVSEDKLYCSSAATLTLDLEEMYQVVEGFGGAVTDSAGMNWKSMVPKLQAAMIDTYFGVNGIEYNMVRVPIGCSDFSTRPYSYADYPLNDTLLSNFTLATEDLDYKIPMIQRILKVATSPVHLVGTTWTPPRWMKDRYVWRGLSLLKRDYFDTYALYHIKFLEAYAQNNISFWGITTTNEPINGRIPLPIPVPSLGWNPALMSQWIVENLGPQVRNSSFKDLKILAADDQRLLLPYWLGGMSLKNPEAYNYIDGIAVHYYSDFLVPSSLLDLVHEHYPDKFILNTEASEGSFPGEPKVLLGSWKRATDYITDILQDLNHHMVGWIDWNLCLNPEGGPNFLKNNVDSPIIVMNQNEFVKQPMFYALGHVSKFVPRGSRRIKTAQEKCLFSKGVQNAAFLTPNKTIVVVLYNPGATRTIVIRINSKEMQLEMESKAISTVEFLI